jgi:hypothetical protein
MTVAKKSASMESLTPTYDANFAIPLPLSSWRVPHVLEFSGYYLERVWIWYYFAKLDYTYHYLESCLSSIWYAMVLDLNLEFSALSHRCVNLVIRYLAKEYFELNKPL